MPLSEPKNVDRLNEIGSTRTVPLPRNGNGNPVQSINKLDALRHRLTASLPDVSTHGAGSSAAEAKMPFIIFPDGYIMPSSAFFAAQNHVPRSWRIGGLLESWSNDALNAGEVPSVNTGGVFTPTTSGWSRVLEDLTTLSLLERLHSLRSLWRDANQVQANNKHGNILLAQQFFQNLPTTGISPDTARSYLQYEAGVPDNVRHINFNYKKPPKEPMKTLLPARSNSFLRSANRLKPSTN